jgi:hypothetical protein
MAWVTKGGNVITVRPLVEEDRQSLNNSIINDLYHRDSMNDDFFYDRRAISTVYEKDNKPIMFVKGSTVLRLDIQFCNNSNHRNNAAALNELSKIIETAKSSGFSELVFNTDSPLLKAFCCKHFGFVELNNELRRYL